MEPGGILYHFEMNEEMSRYAVVEQTDRLYVQTRGLGVCKWSWKIQCLPPPYPTQGFVAFNYEWVNLLSCPEWVQMGESYFAFGR